MNKSRLMITLSAMLLTFTPVFSRLALLSFAALFSISSLAQQTPVNGRNATVVYWGVDANNISHTFKKQVDGTWSQVAGGRVVATLQELGRDDWTIYLLSSSGGAKVGLNLWRKELTINGSPNQAGKIVKAEADPVTAAPQTCPAGQQLISNKCETVVTALVQFANPQACPSGQSRNANNACVAIATPQAAGADGWWCFNEDRLIWVACEQPQMAVDIAPSTSNIIYGKKPETTITDYYNLYNLGVDFDQDDITIYKGLAAKYKYGIGNTIQDGWSSRDNFPILDAALKRYIKVKFSSLMGANNIVDTLQEVNRDDWTIYLRSAVNGAKVDLNLFRKELLNDGVADNSGKIVKFEAGPVNGRNATAVYWGRDANNISHTFKKQANGTWSQVAGGRVVATLQELNRDDWTIYLRSSSGGVAVNLNLWQKKLLNNGVVNESGIIVSADSGPLNGRSATEVYWGMDANNIIYSFKKQNNGTWSKVHMASGINTAPLYNYLKAQIQNKDVNCVECGVTRYEFIGFFVPEYLKMLRTGSNPAMRKQFSEYVGYQLASASRQTLDAWAYYSRRGTANLNEPYIPGEHFFGAPTLIRPEDLPDVPYKPNTLSIFTETAEPIPGKSVSDFKECCMRGSPLYLSPREEAMLLQVMIPIAAHSYPGAQEGLNNIPDYFYQNVVTESRALNILGSEFTKLGISVGVGAVPLFAFNVAAISSVATKFALKAELAAKLGQNVAKSIGTKGFGPMLSNAMAPIGFGVAVFAAGFQNTGGKAIEIAIFEDKLKKDSYYKPQTEDWMRMTKEQKVENFTFLFKMLVLETGGLTITVPTSKANITEQQRIANAAASWRG
jgi:hypothetical protein